MPGSRTQIQKKSPSVEKQRARTRSPVQKPDIMLKTIQFFTQLSCKFFEQLSSGAISLNLVVELVDVVAHRYQKDLG